MYVFFWIYLKLIFGWRHEVVLWKGRGWTGIQSPQACDQWAAYFPPLTLQTKCDKWAGSHKYSSSSLSEFDYIVPDGIGTRCRVHRAELCNLQICN